MSRTPSNSIKKSCRSTSSWGTCGSKAITLGEIARIYTQPGAVWTTPSNSIKNSCRPYEQLGDVRERAVSLGDIAEIQRLKGNVDEAYRLRTEQLQLNEHLDYKDGIASASWRIE